MLFHWPHVDWDVHSTVLFSHWWKGVSLGKEEADEKHITFTGQYIYILILLQIQMVLSCSSCIPSHLGYSKGTWAQRKAFQLETSVPATSNALSRVANETPLLSSCTCQCGQCRSSPKLAWWKFILSSPLFLHTEAKSGKKRHSGWPLFHQLIIHQLACWEEPTEGGHNMQCCAVFLHSSPSQSCGQEDGRVMALRYNVAKLPKITILKKSNFVPMFDGGLRRCSSKVASSLVTCWYCWFTLSSLCTLSSSQLIASWSPFPIFVKCWMPHLREDSFKKSCSHRSTFCSVGQVQYLRSAHWQTQMSKSSSSFSLTVSWVCLFLIAYTPNWRTSVRNFWHTCCALTTGIAAKDHWWMTSFATTVATFVPTIVMSGSKGVETLPSLKAGHRCLQVA